VWETYGYADLDTKSERVQMRRVMPAVAGGSTGELIWVYRSTFELGLVAVWRAGGDLIDPDFAEDARRRSGWNAVAQTSAPMQVLDLADLTRRLIDALAAPEPNAPVLDAARRYLARHGLLEAPTSGHTSSIWQSVPDRSVAPSNESHAE